MKETFLIYFHPSANDDSRRAIWESNLKTVQEHNAKADQGLYTYWLGMNQFADKVESFSHSI